VVIVLYICFEEIVEEIRLYGVENLRGLAPACALIAVGLGFFFPLL